MGASTRCQRTSQGLSPAYSSTTAQRSLESAHYTPANQRYRHHRLKVPCMPSHDDYLSCQLWSSLLAAKASALLSLCCCSAIPLLHRYQCQTLIGPDKPVERDSNSTARTLMSVCRALYASSG